MRIRFRWPEGSSGDRCPECGHAALPDEAGHSPDCRYFLVEEQDDEPVTSEEWARASRVWHDHNGFPLRSPVAA